MNDPENTAGCASGGPPEAAADDAHEMTPEQLAEAKRYARQKLWVELADKGLDLVYLGAMAWLIARPLDLWLQEVVANAWLRLAALYLVLIGAGELISLPLAYYSGYTLEHRYGLSRQSRRRWLVQRGKRDLLAAGFGLALFLGLYTLIWYTGAWWWLAAAAGFFVVSVVLGQLAPVLIVPLFYKVDRIENPELNERLARLAEGTGLRIEGVYRLGLGSETAKANAMLAGLGRTRRVLMGDNLLEHFTPEEIEVVFAHEIGHHVYRHIPKMIAAGLVTSALGFWLCDAWLLFWVGQVEGGMVERFPVYTLPMLLLTLAVLALVAGPVQNAVSRYYERQCDRYALRRTRDPAAYVSAFRKLARLNKADPHPHPVEVFLFHSHPPIAERLRLAEQAS